MGSTLTTFAQYMKGTRNASETKSETCGELYARLSEGFPISKRAFEMRFAKLNARNYATNRVCASQEVEKMEQAYPAKIQVKLKAGNSPVPNVAPAVSQKAKRQSKDWDMVAVRGLLGLGVVAHAVLIWHEMGYLWGEAGAIAGGIVFALIVPAVILIRKRADTKPAKDILHVIWAVDIFAGLVHEKALYHQGTNAFGAGISEYGTGCLAAVISLIACALIYFYLETGLVVEKTKK